MRKLVTISRQYGSGGRIIGKLLAEKLQVPFYDKEIIDLAAEESGYSKEVVETTELKAKNSFAYNFSSAIGFGNSAGIGSGVGSGPLSVNERIFIAQFKAIKEIGEKNEGVIVGRCADYVLRDMPGVSNIFICGELKDRIRRAIDLYGIAPEEAESIVETYDRARHNYYDYHTGQKWGHYMNYNLSLNSSYITDEEAADIIAAYVEHRRY